MKIGIEAVKKAKTKVCRGIRGCQKLLPITAFGVSRMQADGRHYHCLSCAAEVTRLASRKRRKAKALMSRFKMTLAERDALVVAQGNACARCKNPLKNGGSLDHDRTCCPGRRSCGLCIRGALCHRCNTNLTVKWCADHPQDAYLKSYSTRRAKGQKVISLPKVVKTRKCPRCPETDPKAFHALRPKGGNRLCKACRRAYDRDWQRARRAGRREA